MSRHSGARYLGQVSSAHAARTDTPSRGNVFGVWWLGVHAAARPKVSKLDRVLLHAVRHREHRMIHPYSFEKDVFGLNISVKDAVPAGRLAWATTRTPTAHLCMWSRALHSWYMYDLVVASGRWCLRPARSSGGRCSVQRNQTPNALVEVHVHQLAHDVEALELRITAEFSGRYHRDNSDALDDFEEPDDIGMRIQSP